MHGLKCEKKDKNLERTDWELNTGVISSQRGEQISINGVVAERYLNKVSFWLNTEVEEKSLGEIRERI